MVLGNVAQGIPLKLMAIDQFMSANVSWRGRIVFSIIGISAQERGQDYYQTRSDVKSLVESLNRKYVNADGSLLVVFEERAEKDIRLAERLSFFAAADILMITATRDGLNRYPMEFTLARNKYAQLAGDRFRDPSLPQFDKGLIVISEFISSARVMRGAMTGAGGIRYLSFFISLSFSLSFCSSPVPFSVHYLLLLLLLFFYCRRSCAFFVNSLLLPSSLLVQTPPPL